MSGCAHVDWRVGFCVASAGACGCGYNLFLPILVGPINQGRMDEIMYFNTAMPLLLAMMFCMWMYRVFLPYDPDGLRWDMRVNILRGLRRLAGQRRPPAVTEIIGRSVDGFVRLSTMQRMMAIPMCWSGI